MMAVHRRMLPGSLVNPVIGRAFTIGANAEQRAEGIERIEAPVKAERELIEVGLKVLRLDAPVVCALKPSLQVAENEVDDWQVFFGHCRVARLDDRQMGVAALSEVGVARRGVRNHHRARLNGLFYKSDQRLSGAIGDDFQPQPTCVAPAAPHRLVAFLGGASPNLDGGAHQHGVIRLGATTFAAHRTSDVGFVNFDMIATAEVAADPVATLADHTSAELVQDLERGFVPAEAKLPLELHRRHARRHAGNEISGPKPNGQRRMGALHHGPDSQGRLLAAGPTGQHAGARGEAHGLALFFAVRADEALGPFCALKIPGAGVVIVEQPLEVPERLRERQVLPLENVGEGRHGLPAFPDQSSGLRLLRHKLGAPDEIGRVVPQWLIRVVPAPEKPAPARLLKGEAVKHVKALHQQGPASATSAGHPTDL